MLLKDYLESEATFYSPRPNRSQIASSTSGVNDAEVSQLPPEWHPEVAHRDPRLVDSLIEVLDICIADTLVPEDLKGTFEHHRRNSSKLWKRNEEEADASHMVASVLEEAILFSEPLNGPFELSKQKKARGFSSKVDFLLHDDENNKVVVEVKSPGVFSIAERLYFSGISAFRLNLLANEPTVAQRVIFKMCLCMAAHQSEWGALTCHDRWIFIRLHKKTGERPAYITFSEVEGQASNTRPFRALLGMMFATKRGIDVKSHANLTGELATIEEAEDELEGMPSSQSSLGQSDEDYKNEGPSEGSSQGERLEPPVLRPRRRGRSATPDILVGWSQEVTSSNIWLSLYSAYDAEECPSIGCKPVRLRLERLIGTGSTGCVYEAKLDGSEQHYQSYAVKVVKKGRGEKARRCLTGLYQEFEIYRMIEKAKSEGRAPYATPRCFGLYETELTVSLVMEYAGECLPGLEWRGLKRVEKLELFTAIWELHAMGIRHGDLAPRNVVRSSDGTLRIIDFARSTLHQCPGIHPVGVPTFSAERKGKEEECGELESMWRVLGKPELSQRPPKLPGRFKTSTQVQPLPEERSMCATRLAPHGPSRLRA